MPLVVPMTVLPFNIDGSVACRHTCAAARFLVISIHNYGWLDLYQNNLSGNWLASVPTGTACERDSSAMRTVSVSVAVMST
jgi:hypothetical protein